MSALDLAQSFHVVNAIQSLKCLGLFEAMSDFIDIDVLASRFGLDARMLNLVFQYLLDTTDFFEVDSSEIKLSKHYDEYSEFIFNQYIGAYGPNVINLSKVLQHPDIAGQFVDRELHTMAFSSIGSRSVSLLVSLIRQLELNNVLDMGCGPGTLLLELAKQNTQFCGWGLDLNASMHAEAIDRVEKQGLTSQVNILRGSAFHFHKILDEDVIARVGTVVASSLFNECFADGNSAAIDYLKLLRTHFSSKALLVSDYYGCVGHPKGCWFQNTALHDFVQIISGQGVPPPDLDTWKNIYQQAGCQLVHAVQDQHSSGFIHIVRL